MSKLSGLEIIKRLGTEFKVDPFDLECVGPCSYDLRLGEELFIFDDIDLAGLDTWGNEVTLDTHVKPVLQRLTPVARHGVRAWRLEPGPLYLGSTAEVVELIDLAGTIHGRSTIARYGIQIETAGFVDQGFRGTLTLEIQVAHPVWIYAGDRICQIALEPVIGDRLPYGVRGHYIDQRGPTGPVPVNLDGHGVKRGILRDPEADSGSDPDQ